MEKKTKSYKGMVRSICFLLIFCMFFTFAPLSSGINGNISAYAAVTKKEYRENTLKKLEKVYKYYNKAYYTAGEYEELTFQYNNGVKAIKAAKTKSSMKKAYTEYREILKGISPSILVKYQGKLEKSLLKTYSSLVASNTYSDENLEKMEAVKIKAVENIYSKKTKSGSKKVKALAVEEMKNIPTVKNGGGQSGEKEKEETPEIKPVEINSTTFPDQNFRAVVKSSFDTDGNGILDETEILYARNIYCNEMGIKSLKGIEYLVELRGLYCMDNEIETMDLSSNKLLTGVWCSGNLFTTLDFTPNPVLEWVYCFDCRLTSLNVSNNPELSYLECNTNPLKTLDVTHNPKLEHLMCGSCELAELDLSKNPNLQHLDAFRNKLKTLDVTNNTKLKRLDVWDNPGLGSIDISKCKGLQYYNCANNDITTLDVSNNPELNKLVCSYNDITELDLSGNKKLAILQCEDNKIKKLDLSNNPQLRYMWAAINDFSTLNIGNNPFLLKTYTEGLCREEWFGRSWMIDHGGEDSTGGDSIFYMWLNDNVTISTEPTKEITLQFPEDDYEGLDTKNLVTREAFVEILYRMAGSPSAAGSKTRFTDVEKGASYESALLWGEANSICTGYPYIYADTFGVGKYIRRQDVALMLMRYSEYAGYKRAIDFGRSDEYIDYYDIDYDHWEAICWTSTWNIMDGKGEKGAPKSEQKIDPLGYATISEIETMIKRLLEVNG